MAIQGRSLPFDANDVIPLGFQVPQNGNYAIAINHVDGLFETTNQDIFVEDTYTNIIHDLRLSPYAFNSESGLFNDRFILRYTNDTLGIGEIDDSGISIYTPENEYIIVNSTIELIETIEIYDILGRVIFYNSKINSDEFIYLEPNISDGAYFIKVKLKDGKQKIQKVVLKQ